jgi:HK97 gp10 family phage protein
MIGFKTKMSGTGDLVKKLVKLAGPEVTRTAMGDALQAGAEVYAERMRQLVPVKTGRTQSKIEVKKIKDDYAAMANSPIAHLVEFGTKKASAKPFVRPAADEMKSVAQRAVADHLAREIAKVAGA